MIRTALANHTGLKSRGLCPVRGRREIQRNQELEKESARTCWFEGRVRRDGDLGAIAGAGASLLQREGLHSRQRPGRGQLRQTAGSACSAASRPRVQTEPCHPGAAQPDWQRHGAARVRCFTMPYRSSDREHAHTPGCGPAHALRCRPRSAPLTGTAAALEGPARPSVLGVTNTRGPRRRCGVSSRSQR